MNYNPFFPGGAIGMARVLFDGLVEYEDGKLSCSVITAGLDGILGTPATTSQMAKDVVTFLHWAAEPELDERKKNGIKAVILFSTLTLLSLYVKRFKWTPIKNRKICALFLLSRVSFADCIISIRPARRQETLEDGLVLIHVAQIKLIFLVHIHSLFGVVSPLGRKFPLIPNPHLDRHVCRIMAATTQVRRWPLSNSYN